MRGTTRRWLALLALLWCASTAAGQAGRPATETRRFAARAESLARWVESSLSAGIEASGAPSAILALGQEGEQALITVFERVEAADYVRLRALATLGAFETPTAGRYLERLVQRSTRDDGSLGTLHPARSAPVLRRALEGLTRSAKLLRPPVDVEALVGCLAHRDAHVRKGAADLLASLEGQEIDRALHKRLEREPSRMVRGTLTRALTDRSARRAAPRSGARESDSPPR